MQKVSIRALATAAALFLPACADPAGVEHGPEVDFVFGVHRLANEPPFLVRAEGETVVIRGFLTTPCQPYAATAAAERVGRTLEVRVVGRATGDCPMDVVLDVGYQATVRAAPASYDRLRVRHEWRDAAWPAVTVVDQGTAGR